jgi:hypothetical protein
MITKREREILAIDHEFEAMAEMAACALYDFDHQNLEPTPVPLPRVPDLEVIETSKRRARVALEAAGIRDRSIAGGRIDRGYRRQASQIDRQPLAAHRRGTRGAQLARSPMRCMTASIACHGEVHQIA